MLIRTIIPGWIILGEKMNNDNLDNIKAIFLKHMPNDEDTVSALKDAEDYEELLYLLGFSFSRGPFTSYQGLKQYQADVNTCYGEEMELVLKELFSSECIKEYKFVCWSGPLSSNFYVLEARQPIKEYPFKIASFECSGKQTYVYKSGEKYIESEKEEVYEGKEITEKDIVTEIDSPWVSTGVTYSIYFNYPHQFCVCEYCVPIYDGLDAILYGYGETPEAALKNVKARHEDLRTQAMEKQHYMYPRDHC